MQITVVELDPSITALARKWFYLDQLLEEIPDAIDRLKLITADGRNYLESTAKRYAAIINDTFTGKDPALSLATIEALRIAKTSLLPGGIYATNVVSEQEGEDISFLRDAVTTLNEVFAHVVIIPCEDTSFGLEDNYLVLASDLAHSFSETLPYDDDSYATFCAIAGNRLEAIRNRQYRVVSNCEMTGSARLQIIAEPCGIQNNAKCNKHF